MSAPIIRKRQMCLLKSLASRAGGRTDQKLPITEIAPTLEVKVYGGSQGATYRFVDAVDPKYESGSELSYDFNCLKDELLIQVTHLRYGQDSCGGVVNIDPAIKVTDEGFLVLADYDRTWLSKAIEKEPVTFLQIFITLGVGVGGWLIGRYITPSVAEPPKPVVNATAQPASQPPTEGRDSPSK